ncbi:hypothetical protein KIN20_032020 [Parelaphostrongylus tenuis]|uniref:Uncharacterized protein n=1 Tax=Parelaphostrongylus tenuis TaxID=148309 RepID=A0AAD5R6B0_PARTN|nr:hypothetical protein KIN20_032020 [Parelaphostrongylus tenuis]
MTFKPSAKTSYTVDDVSSGSETGQEDTSRRNVPAWCKRDLSMRIRTAVGHSSFRGVQF